MADAVKAAQIRSRLERIYIIPNVVGQALVTLHSKSVPRKIETSIFVWFTGPHSPAEKVEGKQRASKT